ncbi:unnamed protein product [Lepeophtheirus salmonis]|uniref:(salmon louse) hypothetical protein n=1 Tax=Lepeophtheirus salmonis TaxID=72036 RepID=A0A7R8H3M9_LEPSM|nr:unnamed protein product [Lepeophtheirus salmonis]CAF2844940.1 unnamed protein product [Lepeophtheirus salmonis]
MVENESDSCWRESNYKEEHNQEIPSLEDKNNAATTSGTDYGEGNINIGEELATTKEDESKERYKNGEKLLIPVTKTGVEQKYHITSALPSTISMVLNTLEHFFLGVTEAKINTTSDPNLEYLKVNIVKDWPANLEERVHKALLHLQEQY